MRQKHEIQKMLNTAIDTAVSMPENNKKQCEAKDKAYCFVQALKK